MSLLNTKRRFIVLYDTPDREKFYDSNKDITKAVLVFDEDMELPFGFYPDHLGPEEDDVLRVVAVMDVTDVEDPRVVINNVEFAFTATGAPVQTSP